LKVESQRGRPARIPLRRPGVAWWCRAAGWPRPAAPTPGSPASSPSRDNASSVGLQNGNGVDPARARVSATRERVATPASKGMALPSARSGLAGCGG